MTEQEKLNRRFTGMYRWALSRLEHDKDATKAYVDQVNILKSGDCQALLKISLEHIRVMQAKPKPISKEMLLISAILRR